MRHLQTSDIFAAARLLTKIGVREEVREVARAASENGKAAVQFDMGYDLMFGLIEKATTAGSEKEIYVFIADILECEWEEVRKMNPAKMFNQLKEAASDEEWKDFFGFVARLIKKK